MNTMGTGVASGVAQTGLQAQEVARRRDRQVSHAQGDIKRVRDLLEAHLLALEEGEQDQSASRLIVDGHLPEHGSGGQTPTPPAHQRESQPQDQAPVLQSSNSHPDEDERLYRHLDIRA